MKNIGNENVVKPLAFDLSLGLSMVGAMELPDWINDHNTGADFTSNYKEKADSEYPLHVGGFSGGSIDLMNFWTTGNANTLYKTTTTGYIEGQTEGMMYHHWVNLNLPNSDGRMALIRIPVKTCWQFTNRDSDRTQHSDDIVTYYKRKWDRNVPGITDENTSYIFIPIVNKKVFTTVNTTQAYKRCTDHEVVKWNFKHTPYGLEPPESDDGITTTFLGKKGSNYSSTDDSIQSFNSNESFSTSFMTLIENLKNSSDIDTEWDGLKDSVYQKLVGYMNDEEKPLGAFMCSSTLLHTLPVLNNPSYTANRNRLIVPNWSKFSSSIPCWDYTKHAEIYDYLVNGNVKDALNMNDLEFASYGLDTIYYCDVYPSSSNQLFQFIGSPTFTLKPEWKGSENIPSDMRTSILKSLKYEVTVKVSSGGRASKRVIYFSTLEKFDFTRSVTNIFNASGLGGLIGGIDQQIVQQIELWIQPIYGTQTGSCIKIICKTSPSGWAWEFDPTWTTNKEKDTSRVIFTYHDKRKEDEKDEDNHDHRKDIPDEDIDPNDDDHDGQDNGLNYFSTTYKLTQSQCNSLASKMWNEGVPEWTPPTIVLDEGIPTMLKSCFEFLGAYLKHFIDMLTDSENVFGYIQNNPIENIVACKFVPCNISGSSSEIVLGKWHSEINATKVSHHEEITVGTITVPRLYNNFIDYDPYTNITIFLPWIGFRSLPSSPIMGKELKVKYIMDIITGMCKALIYVDGIYSYSFDGECGINIPLTESNNAEHTAGLLSNMASSSISFVSNPSSGSLVNGVMNTVSSAIAPYHYESSGTYSSSCGFYEPHDCYLIIDRPFVQIGTTYDHDYGRPCNLTASVNSLRGFTKFNHDIDTSGINCTNEERQEIERILQSGFYA